MNRVVKQAAELRSQSMTPVRAESFQQGAAFALELLASVGVSDAIGTDVQQLIADLQAKTAEARRELVNLTNVQLANDALDEFGTRISALTITLLDSFRRAYVGTERSGTSSAQSEKVWSNIVSAVSYIVWAYAGNPQPAQPPQPGMES